MSVYSIVPANRELHVQFQGILVELIRKYGQSAEQVYKRDDEDFSGINQVLHAYSTYMGVCECYRKTRPKQEGPWDELDSIMFALVNRNMPPGRAVLWCDTPGMRKESTIRALQYRKQILESELDLLSKALESS